MGLFHRLPKRQGGGRGQVTGEEQANEEVDSVSQRFLLGWGIQDGMGWEGTREMANFVLVSVVIQECLAFVLLKIKSGTKLTRDLRK